MKQLSLQLIIIPVLSVIGIVCFSMPHNFSANYNKSNNMLQDTARVELVNTRFSDMAILYIKDTAPTTEVIGKVFGKDYEQLMKFVQANNLSPLKFIGWYYTTQPPWLMDVGVEVNRLPVNTTGKIQAKIEIGGEVLIAHVWGPYNQVAQAYKQIQNWLQQNNRKARENPFEVYINDPATVVSPSDIQTDIYQPLE